jgi:hypothetical protein
MDAPAQHLTALTRLLLAACAVALVADPTDAVAQERSATPPSLASQDHPVPQEFDWHLEVELPAETEWGIPIQREASEQIRSWTTKPEFISPLVDYLPAVEGVVSPFDHFGYAVGRPGTLHRVDELYGYYEALAASSGRVNMLTLGLSEEENEFRLIQIGSAENLARLDRIREGLNALADPRHTEEAQARTWIDELPVIYTIYTGLHSPETAHPEMAMELAYRLAVAEHPMVQDILENVVVFLVPVVEPDGRNRMVDWYRRHGQAIYDDADAIPRAPYWGYYAGHDNNRNAIQLYLRLTETMLDLFMEWKHPISLDVHEAGDAAAYHYFSTGTGPYNEYIDPIIIKEWQWMANYESAALERYGMPGVFTHDFYDGWFPGYLFWITNNRNAIGRFTETWAGFAGLPWTRIREPRSQFITREWFRPNPAYPRAHWSFRNVINYMQTGMLHSLYWASTNREEILEQFWVKSKNSLERGLSQAPYAWVVPRDQARRADASYLLNLVRKHGIEVHEATEGGHFGDVEVRSGDFVIRMDQPYRNFAHMLMDVQHYPSEGREVEFIRGGMAWTLPLMHNVEAFTVDDPVVQRLQMREVLDEVPVAGGLVERWLGEAGPEAPVRPGQAAHETGNITWYVAHPRASAMSLQARYELGDLPVEVAMDPVRTLDGELPHGAWLFPADRVDAAELERWAERFGYDLHGLEEGTLGNVTRRPMPLPRLALLHTWRETRDSGAVRFALDHLEIPYTLLAETELREGGLRDRFDVILFPEQGRNSTGKQIFEGVDDRHGPLAYTQTPEWPNHGIPNGSEDITGGMGFEGLQALRNFVEGGGTFIALGSGSRLPIEYSLSRNARLFEPGRLIIPGSILKGVVEDPSNPLTFGYEGEIPLWHKFGPYIETVPSRPANVPVRYPREADELFMSGVVVEPGELSGRPALINHPMGDGHMVLFGFNPMHRYQPHGNFALVWNAIIHWDGL